MSRKQKPLLHRSDTRLLHSIAALLLVLLFIALASCAGGRKSPVAANAPAAECSSLDAALAELDALETPEGVDAALFEELKGALREALICRPETIIGGAGVSPASIAIHGRDARATSGVPHRIASTPPTGADNGVDDLTVENDEGRPRFSWHYRNAGDYDQNGAVGISDITPIAMHYGEEVPEIDGVPDDYSIQAVVDGSGSGKVDIADITPIAMNYGVNCAGYKLKNAPGGGGAWTDHADFPLGNASGEGRLEFAETVDVGEGEYYRVVPVDANGEEGEPSNIVQFGTTPPAILSVEPTTVIVGTLVQFSASVSGSSPISYQWTFDEACNPYLSTLPSPLVTVPSERGEYACSLAVHNPFGDDTQDFILTVTGYPPVIEDVQHTPGGETELITFTATVTGDEPMAYHWEFNGGLDADSSSEIEPVLTATAQGNYDGTLNVTNEAGEDSQPFNYTINPPPEAPEILDIGPTGGEIGAEITISANVSGSTPLTYNWDFDGASSTSSSDKAAPTITLTLTPGVYACSLEVSNAYGTDNEDFSMNVYSSFEGVMLVVDSGGVQDPPDHVGSHCNLISADGRPAISYRNSTDETLQYIRADDAYGKSWPASPKIIVSAHDAGDWSSMALVGGNPAISYYNDTDDDLMFIGSYDAAGDAWWLVPVKVDEMNNAGRHTRLAVVKSGEHYVPAISYYTDTSSSLKYVYAQNPEGFEWNAPIVVDSGSCGVFNSLANINGRPAISYRHYGNKELRFVRADDESGSGWPDAPVVVENDHDPWYTCLFVANGNPAIVYQDDEAENLMFVRANDENGDTWGDPVILDDGGDEVDTGQYTSLAVINGLPAVAYMAGYPDGALMYIVAKNAWGGAWEDPVVVDSGGENNVGQYASLCEISGHPAIAYYDMNDCVLKYVIASDTYGYEWPEEP
ncbi:PKD domain-containing protein [bacterium]|nr:PKD domain-containing protein [bacterium]